MVTFLQHVKNLTRFTDDTEEEIIISILHNLYMIDDNSLFSFCLEDNDFGRWMTVMWIDGNGDTIHRWLYEQKEKYKVDKIFFVSNRWKAMGRKCKDLKIKPLGVLCELEVI